MIHFMCLLLLLVGCLTSQQHAVVVCWLLNITATCSCCWLLNVPATCECVSGTDLLRQFYVLPHWDRSCRPNFPSHPVTVYWHRADQSQHWPYITPGVWQGSHWSANFEVTGMTRPRKIASQTHAGFEPGIFHSRGGRHNHWLSEVVYVFAGAVRNQRYKHRIVWAHPSLKYTSCVAIGLWSSKESIHATQYSRWQHCELWPWPQQFSLLPLSKIRIADWKCRHPIPQYCAKVCFPHFSTSSSHPPAPSTHPAPSPQSGGYAAPVVSVSVRYGDWRRWEKGRRPWRPLV